MGLCTADPLPLYVTTFAEVDPVDAARRLRFVENPSALHVVTVMLAADALQNLVRFVFLLLLIDFKAPFSE